LLSDNDHEVVTSYDTVVLFITGCCADDVDDDDDLTLLATETTQINAQTIVFTLHHYNPLLMKILCFIFSCYYLSKQMR